MMDSPDCMALLMDNLHELGRTSCITHDMENDLCLSDTVVPLTGSRCILCFVYSEDCRNECLF